MWKPPRRSNGRRPTSTRGAGRGAGRLGRYGGAVPAHVRRLAAQLAYAVRKEALRDPKIKRLLGLLPEKVPETTAFSVTAAWKADVQMGRSTSYYALEEEALYADLPHVIAAHNRGVILREVERRRRELVLEVAARFWPLQALPHKERLEVLALVGGGVPPRETPNRKPSPGEIPTGAARKYRLRLASTPRDGDGYVPDPEVEEIIAESYALPEDILTASLAEAGLLREGEKVNIAYF